MIRILFYLALLTLLAAGLAWLADQPGGLTLTWNSYDYAVRPHIALALLVAAFVVVSFVLWLLRSVVRLPQRLRQRRARRRETRGRQALSQGMVAVGAGDIRLAQRSAAEAGKYLGEEPLTLLLRAQTAQLSGDRPGAEAIFTAMANRADTRLFGLRGLHLEARRRGDAEAAHVFAAEAHRSAALPWAGQAVLEHYAANADWVAALASVDANVAKKLIDGAKADRLRAVLKTAIAMDIATKDPDGALELAREAIKLAPGLVPAATLAGRLFSRKGNLRPAAKVLETAWRLGPHPDLAAAYVDLRPGDSAADRLNRAQALMRLAPNDPESRITVARAALERRDFAAARATLAPLLSGQGTEATPTVRVCLMMADIEETEHGLAGAAREWLARASRARRDKAWIAEGVISDRWAPASPSGQLDAYVWQAPVERLSPALAITAEPLALVALPAIASAPAVLEALPEAPPELEPETKGAAAPAPIAAANVVPLAAAQASRPLGGGEAVEPAGPAPRSFAAAPRNEANARRKALYSVPVAPDDPGPETAES